MSHIIYQTEGIILRKSNFGEADRILTIFTEKFGKISAVAQGVRYLKSKLRYNLETMSRSRIGLVASKKTDWRIIDAEEIDNYRKIIESPENLAVFSR
ncbi:DNA repair protein RecO, partial [Patescibacteria group bacterium]|nr:DNA repair protein RecO [Patescibacteria group bacterium]